MFMPTSVLSLLIQLLIAFQFSGTTAASDQGDSTQYPDSSVVLVELFTSEGCSSCPPADRVLSELDQKQPIKGVQVITLSEHVDYWNRLGWKDPFSSADFSRRQTEYARVLGNTDIYTPQMVVDGKAEFVGSNLATAREQIAKAARSQKTAMSLSVKKVSAKSIQLSIQVPDTSAAGSHDADVIVAITESGLMSDVARGENAGKKLSHSGVVRRLVVVGSIQGKGFAGEKTIDLDSKWNEKNLRAVAFIQERQSRRVLGATELRLSSAF